MLQLSSAAPYCARRLRKSRILAAARRHLRALETLIMIRRSIMNTIRLFSAPGCERICDFWDLLHYVTTIFTSFISTGRRMNTTYSQSVILPWD